MNRNTTRSGWLAGMGTRWQAMAPRERLLVQLAAWVLGAGLIWMLGITPAWKTLQKSPDRLRALDAQLVRMQDWAAQAQAIRQDGSSPVPERSTTIGLIENTARDLGPGTQVNVMGNQVVVRLTQVAPDLLARSLDQLRRAARVVPVSAELEQVGDRWSGSLTLAGPGLGD